MTQMRFEDWTGARPWALQALQAWRDATAPARVRAAEPLDVSSPPAVALFECFTSGRPFSFCRDCDTVERVRLRNAWEWRRRVSTAYARVAAMLPIERTDHE